VPEAGDLVVLQRPSGDQVVTDLGAVADDLQEHRAALQVANRYSVVIGET
jgi:hypothetical protein